MALGQVKISYKVHITPLQFYERPTLVPVFPNQKKSKQGFYEESRYRTNVSCKNEVAYRQLKESWGYLYTQET